MLRDSTRPVGGGYAILAGMWTRRRGPRIVDGDLFRRLCRARDFIAEEHAGPLDLAAAARVAGASRFHFLREFRRAFGATPHEHLTSVRMERAKQGLRRGVSVTEVCFDVGFASLGSFSALFRRHVGVAPSAYQRELRRQAVVPVPAAMWTMPFCFAVFYGDSGVAESAILEKPPLIRP
jgi:AraC-like DNA-binding protein